MWTPDLGRFMSIDPLHTINGNNLYGGYFVGRGVDPYGTFFSPTTWIGGAIGGIVGGLSGAVGGIVGGGGISGAFSGLISGAAGGFVTGALIGSGVPAPIAGGIGGAISGAINASLNAALQGKEICTFGFGLSIAVSTGIGIATGGLGEFIGEGATIIQSTSYAALAWFKVTTQDLVVEGVNIFVGTAVTTYFVNSSGEAINQGTQVEQNYIEQVNEYMKPCKECEE